MAKEPNYRMPRIKEGEKYDWHNITDLFERAHLSIVPLKARQSLVNRELVSNVQGLERLCHSAIVPRVIAPNQPDGVEALRTGGRTFMLNESYDIDLSLFGWGEEGETQEFGVEVKGAGTDDDYLENLLREKLYGKKGGKPQISPQHKYYSDYARFLQEMDQFRRGNIPLDYKLNIIRGITMHRPLGGQNANYAIGSLEDSERCIKNKSLIKIAPVFEVPFFPQELMKRISFLDHTNDSKYKGAIAQEKRLMPSNIRGIYLDCITDDEKLKTLCSKLGSTIKEMEIVYRKMIADVVRFLEIIPLSSRRTKNGYKWCRVGDIKLVYDAPGEFWGRSEAFYLAKDIVMAPSGIYFVDLESLDPNERCSEKNFEKRQELYIANVLKDLTRVLAKYRIGMLLCSKQQLKDKLSLPKLRRGVLKDITRACKNQHLSVTLHSTAKQEETVRVKIHYQNFNEQNTFDIPLEKLRI